MSITFSCPACEHEYRGRDDAEGKLATCKNCGEKFRVVGYDDVDFEPIAPKRKSGAVNRQRRSRPRTSKARPNTQNVLMVVGGIGFIFVLSVVAIVYSLVSKVQQENEKVHSPEIANTEEQFRYDNIPLPIFPDIGPGRPIGSQGVTYQEIRINGGNEPGQQMTLRIYLPRGQHADKSLACVLVPPAGTPLICGNAVDGSDYHDETLPYAEAGAVTIMFSLDGPFDEDANNLEFRDAYLKFRAAAAGLVNVRNSIDFALAKIPAVDPERIVIAGHSSAGTLSLLSSSHEPRLAASIAYCPAADVEGRLKEMIAATSVNLILPQLEEFTRKSAPMTHLKQTKCPVFLFHAQDDSNTPVADTQRYQQMLQSAGKDSELKLVPYGDHYQSMIDEGIPTGIAWLRNRDIF